jgi:hypothetical protein
MLRCGDLKNPPGFLVMSAGDTGIAGYRRDPTPKMHPDISTLSSKFSST